MSKKVLVGAFTALLVLGLASIAFAAEGSGKGAGLWIYFGVAVACGFGIGVAALGTGLGMGNAINGALQGTARNPEAGGKIMTTDPGTIKGIELYKQILTEKLTPVVLEAANREILFKNKMLRIKQPLLTSSISVSPIRHSLPKPRRS